MIHFNTCIYFQIVLFILTLVLCIILTLVFLFCFKHLCYVFIFDRRRTSLRKAESVKH